MIETKSHTKFEAIKKRVRRDIASGRYQLAERLPSERELAELYGVNRLTVNRALTELVQEQWLYRVNGKGTFVSNLYQNQAQKRERCRIHLVTVSLRRMIDVSFSHFALNFFRHQEEGGDCTVHETGANAENEYALLEELLADPECYILLVGFCNPRSRKLIREHAARFVLLGMAPELVGSVIEVHTDFEAGGRMMMEHLWEAGHRRIAYCGDTSTGGAPGRFHAWQSVLQEHGRTESSDYIMDAGNYDLAGDVERQEFIQGALDRFLGLPEPPTVVFCSNDDLASTMIHHCWQRGMRVPEDLSICGFDGSVALALDALAITTIRQPYEEIFATALSLLQRQTPKNFPQLLLQPTLAPGKTVKNISKPKAAS